MKEKNNVSSFSSRPKKKSSMTSLSTIPLLTVEDKPANEPGPENKFAMCRVFVKDNLWNMFDTKNRGRCTTTKILVLAFAWALFWMILFGSIYGGVGYNTMFETTKENENKNWENSIVASMMLQSNAMGSVTPISTAGRLLSASQTCLGWVWMVIMIPFVTTL
jgi:hypothetical protein